MERANGLTMAKVDLPWLKIYPDRHGKLRCYYRRPGFQSTRLPMPGEDGFLEAYELAGRQPRSAGEKTYPAGSIWALIAAYYQSAGFKGLQPQTQYVYRNILDRFREAFGDLPARQLDKQNLLRILDKKAATPGAAANLLKRLRGVYAFGIERGLVSHDPTAGVRLKARKTGGFRPWTDADIDRFMAHWPDGSRAHLALMLLLYTGQRRSDVVRMGRQHVRGDFLWVKQKKTGTELEIPIHPALRAVLDELPKDNLTFLMTAYGKPFSEAGFTQWFVECAQEAGLPPRSGPHGLRKAAGRRLAEAGCSALEIAAITGHESLKEVERYTKSASQRRLAKNAIAALKG